jgi:transcriptional regulator with GAF, ATPase, and Fis domain
MSSPSSDDRRSPPPIPGDPSRASSGRDLKRTHDDDARRVVGDLLRAQAMGRLVGSSPAFTRALQHLPTMARGDATVLVCGETGTGKELVARAFHYMGGRASFPFVPVNCGALPDTLLEAELFGHERGAFTDARERRTGLVAQAIGGTLFLDEVDSLSPRAQVALLRLLQDRTLRPLGGGRETQVDVRFVAASNASLPEMVRRGEFRADLFYRLAVLTLTLPPLRERREDVLELAGHLLARNLPPGRPPLCFSPCACAALGGPPGAAPPRPPG